MTGRPDEQPPDALVLGELYYRFVQGAWNDAQEHLKSTGLVKGSCSKQERDAAMVEYVAATLPFRCHLAETVWAPHELAYQEHFWVEQGFTEKAGRLARPEASMDLARRLFYRPLRQACLPCFRGGQGTFRVTYYDVLVWFHFELYPSLKEKFLAGEFPAVQDLPLTALRIAPAQPSKQSSASASQSVQGTGGGDGIADLSAPEYVTLREFMKTRCEAGKHSDSWIDSKAHLLLAHNRQPRPKLKISIRLPECDPNWHTGQSKRYHVADLEKAWPGYCKVLDLPALKPQSA